jgi:hypothetical protein
MPDFREMPLLLTVYDPADGGINCDSDCAHLAIVPMNDALYGNAAACPLGYGFVGYDQTAVFSHSEIGERACLDTGGDVQVEYILTHGEWQWVIRLDLLEDLSEGVHHANGWLIDGWTVHWEPVGALVDRLLN